MILYFPLLLFFLTTTLLGHFILDSIKLKLNKFTYLSACLLIGVVLTSWFIFIVSYFIPFSALGIIIVTILILCFLNFCFLAKLLGKGKSTTRVHYQNLLKKVFQKKYEINYPILIGFIVLFLIFSQIWSKMLVMENGDLVAGWVNIWGDWAAHLSYTSSFAYGDNFPPQMPILAGYPFTYTFMVDFISAVFIKLGLPLIPAMLFPGIFLSITFCLLFFDLVSTFLKSHVKAFLALLIFLFNGGLGFYYFFEDIKNKSFFSVLNNLPREYTHLDQEANIQIINHISAEFIPQRAFLLGICLVILVLLLFQSYIKHRISKQVYFAGLIVGLLPLIHLHSFLFANLLAVFTFFIAFDKKHFKIWLIYLIVVLSLSLPQLYFFFSHVKDLDYPRWQLGWLVDNSNDNFFWFWFRNLGIRLFLIPLGFIVSPKHLKPLFLLFLILFTIPNLFLLQPFEWDNTKLFTYSFLISSIFVVISLAFFCQKGIIGKILTGLFFFLAVSAGVLDVVRLSQFQHRKIFFISEENIAAAEWVKQNTPLDSVFLTAGNHDHPIPVLSGRKILLGFEGWLWTYGIDYGERKQIIENFIFSPSQSKLKNIEADYIFFGPFEKESSLKSLENWLENNLTPVYKQKNTTIYKT